MSSHDSPVNRPEQKDFDAVCCFVDTVEELGQEPFFSRDEPRSISIHGEKRTFKLGDRFHFRSALITFRRLWMSREPESFENIARVARHYLDETDFGLFSYHATSIRSSLKSPAMGVAPVNGEKLLDLWLNAVFAHSGFQGKIPKRPQFDKLIEQYGHGAVEYAARHLVWVIGIEYRNIRKLVFSPLLDKWLSDFQDLKPSFRRGSAFGTKRREKTKDGHLIIRQSSSEYFSEESYEQRFLRILSRSGFRELKNVLQDLGFSDRELSKLVLKHQKLEPLIAESEFTIELVDKLEDPESFLNSTPSEPCSFNGLWNNEGDVSAILFKNDRFTTDPVGIAILNSSYHSFRTQLFEE